jgi:Fe-S-cluster-containing dehydrogenase component
VLPKQDDGLNRRDFLSVMAASMALASLTGCAAAPPEKIVPYVRPPEELLPGKPIRFATSMPSSGYGLGLVVESHEGRPIKIAGNKDHPASLGATDVFAEASLLSLYDPDRSQTVSQDGRISTWDAFITALEEPASSLQKNGGSGLRILSEPVVSPCLADLLKQLLAKYPSAAWHQYTPVNQDNSRAGAQLAFGRFVDPLYDFENADVIVSLDSDFLSDQPGNLNYARKFAARRKLSSSGGAKMNRLYVVESGMTITGAMADHRFAVRSSDIAGIARSIAAGGGQPQWISTVLQDLEDHRGRSIVIAGRGQPPEVHAIAHELNRRFGNAGKTVRYIEPVEFNAAPNVESLQRLMQDISAGSVSVLLMLGGNPAYNAPADLDFAGQLSRVPLRIHHSPYFDETGERCHWHIPESHYLESWGDTRAWDGTTSIIQPLLIPLYQTKTSYELISALLGDPSRSNYEIVRGFWEKQHQGADFESFWTDSVKRGVIAQSAASAVEMTSRGSAPTQEAPPAASEIEVVLRPDPTVFDGRWANNSWLQELPKPVTKLVWDNAASMSDATASRLGVHDSEMIEIKTGDRTITAPALISTGFADNSITLTLGYGRKRSGQVGTGIGYDAYAIRTSSSPWIIRDASIRKTGEAYKLVTTQDHYELNHRHMVRRSTADQYAADPQAIREEIRAPEPDETLYAPHETIDYAWGMAIDLSACIGCNSCVTACQAENNIPVVGKGQAANGREMHWLRIDTYFESGFGNPDIYFEPMLCQHCENAPCELVCPVEATSHSAEGLNEMTYNRCVGTRYCSNNCPYKVRHFNFFQYARWDIPQLKMLYNPDVTVRSRGVMEKCTYCVQRINRARIHAKVEDRKIRDGEVITACQAACPADAIVFGNVKDTGSEVSKWKAEPRNYGVLAELNTRPRTTYLAKLTNPNPAFATTQSARKAK